MRFKWYNVEKYSRGGVGMGGGDGVFMLSLLILCAGLVFVTAVAVRLVNNGKQKTDLKEERLAAVEDKLDKILIAMKEKSPE